MTRKYKKLQSQWSAEGKDFSIKLAPTFVFLLVVEEFTSSSNESTEILVAVLGGYPVLLPRICRVEKSRNKNVQTRCRDVIGATTWSDTCGWQTFSKTGDKYIRQVST